MYGSDRVILPGSSCRAGNRPSHRRLADLANACPFSSRRSVSPPAFSGHITNLWSSVSERIALHDGSIGRRGGRLIEFEIRWNHAVGEDPLPAPEENGVHPEREPIEEPLGKQGLDKVEAADDVDVLVPLAHLPHCRVNIGSELCRVRPCRREQLTRCHVFR